MVRELQSALFWVVIALPIATGLFGLWAMTRPPIRERGDRRHAIVGSLSVALFPAVGFGLLGYLLDRGMSASPAHPLVSVWLAVQVAGLVTLGGIGGYALLARFGAGPVALIGVVAGPFVMMGVPIFIASAISGLR